MIGTIAKREFLDNLLSFKFIACVLTAIILIVFSVTFLANDYQSRLKDYDLGVSASQAALTKVPVYSYLEIRIFKKPIPLSVFVSGVERETGNYVELTHRDIPASLKGGQAKNEFSHMFSFLDLSSVVIIIFTLLAILLSYNAISGEKEEGVLALALANEVPRYKYILGKYCGILISLAVPLTLLFSLGLLIVLVRGIEMPAITLTSFILIYVCSLLYLSCTVLIGIFVSSIAKDSSSALLYLLGFYLIFVFLLPLAISGLSDGAIVQKANYFDKNFPSITTERDKKIEEALSDIKEPRTWRLASGFAPRGRQIMKRLTPPELLEYHKSVNRIEQKIIEDYAQKINELRKTDDASVARIRRIDNFVYASFPPTNFLRISDIIANTGGDSITAFFAQIEIYWRSYVRYLEDKDAYGLRYFYPYLSQFTAQEMSLMEKIAGDYIERKNEVGYRGKYFAEANSYNPEIKYLDLREMPSFPMREETVEEKLRKIVPYVLIMVLYNLCFLVLAHFSFNRYDPRRRV